MFAIFDFKNLVLYFSVIDFEMYVKSKSYKADIFFKYYLVFKPLVITFNIDLYEITK